MPDSLLRNIDSLSSISPDSFLLADSLQRVDSLALVDSVKATIPALPTGMEGMYHPSIPATETWVFIVLSILFLFLVTGIIQSAGTLLQNFKAFFSRKDPVNLILNPTANLAQFQLFITIFTIFVPALLAYEIDFSGQGKFSFTTFAVFAGLFSGFYFLKHLLFEIVGNTFFDSRITKSYKVMYFSMLNVLAMLSFPILILYTYQPANWQEPLIISAFALVAIFYITLIIKLFQIFFTKPLALFYIFLYLCTLEILPVLLLVRMCEKFT